MLGLAIAVWMLFASGMYIYSSLDSGDIYYAGWWVGYVDKLEEEQTLWRKTRWFGQGDEYYQYDYDIFVSSPKESSGMKSRGDKRKISDTKQEIGMV